MPTINLGVNDVPYAVGRGRTERSTARIAEILEDRYHVMEIFAESNMNEISEHIANNGAGVIEEMFGGVETRADLLAGVELWIEERFKVFIDDEVEAFGIPGVPTAAAEKGRSRRGRRVARAGGSFVDTGLYRDSFMVWIEDG